jgi:hypothetical protein
VNEDGRADRLSVGVQSLTRIATLVAAVLCPRAVLAQQTGERLAGAACGDFS